MSPIPLRFDGRVAVVTGAGNGLGRTYALELARRGASVVVNDLGGDAYGRGASRVADAVVDEIRRAGGTATANYDTVATRSGGERIVAAALEAFGRVDIVINNAGILRNRRFENLTDEDIDGVLDTHLKGAFYVSQAAYRVMQKQAYGRFLFTSSASGMFGLQSQSNYGAAKAGLVGLMNVIALEGKPHGILANALLPRGTSRLDHAMGDEADLKDMPDVTPIMGAFGAEFVTPLAVYLVSEACQATHGMYSAVSGRYARVFVGVADGWHGPMDQPATVEDIAAHWQEVEDRTRYDVPGSTLDEFRPLIAYEKAGTRR